MMSRAASALGANPFFINCPTAVVVPPRSWSNAVATSSTDAVMRCRSASEDVAVPPMFRVTCRSASLTVSKLSP